MSVLQTVKTLGQQVWLDNLSRSLIQSGELAQWLAQGVCGVTSNPAIFQKAFAQDARYADDVARLKQQPMSAKQRYEELAVFDVQAACDVCLPEYERSGGVSGLVSLEVAPDLADKADATVAEAKRLFAAVNRANLMIKVPATDAGLIALTELVAEGIHVNLTLLFSRQQVMRAYFAYCAGLSRRLDKGLPICGIQTVASFFLSRIDTALDSTLPEHLQGKIAIALAKTAYRDWQAFFGGADFAAFGVQNAAPMRLLWASTGTKNPAYSDVLYVENLIGEHTVNTVPDATLAAFVDHGIAASTLTKNSDEAQDVLTELADLGIDAEALALRLQQDGLALFVKAFDDLLKPLA
ncbi:transaldolase [Stenoxybacter acetivorans]|uniref:transaldolase n=1 Tax=Stenoxybacter acetivorans TaxID=422441 RepID=UPI00056328DC|nr:transaldolase [Stenoxybacter acetivorans]